MNLSSLHLTRLRIAGYVAVITLCAWGAISAWHLRSSYDLQTTNTFLKQHGLFTLKSPKQRLESFDGATGALTVATRLHGKHFSATDNNLSLVIAPIPFDRFIPNSLNLQWATVTAPGFGPTDFRSLTAFMSSLRYDERPIGRYLNERVNRRNSGEPDWMVFTRLNDVLYRDKLGTPNLVNNLSLDDGTFALVNYPNPSFDAAYLNRRIIEQAFPQHF